VRRTAYSYRDDPDVPDFDDSAPLIIFDGFCVLCSRGVQWVLARDPGGASRFAAIQEPIPRALYRHYNLDADRFDTFMVIADGAAHLRWAGVLAAARTLPAPWRQLGALGRLVPNFIGDRIYDWVQRNRLRWFGGRDVCFAPTDAERRRFLQSRDAT
jgi:predicted DCC family thiol-disulfide oxidoreductase YuxK